MDARRQQQARIQAGRIRKGAQLHIKRLAQEQLVSTACRPQPYQFEIWPPSGKESFWPCTAAKSRPGCNLSEA